MRGHTVLAAAFFQISFVREDLFHPAQQPQRVWPILFTSHWIDCAANIVHQTHRMHAFDWIWHYHSFLHCQMQYPSSEEMPRAAFVKRMVPFQTAFQGNGTLSNAWCLHSLCRLDGESCRCDFVIVGCIAMDGLETLRMVFKVGKTDAPFPFS